MTRPLGISAAISRASRFSYDITVVNTREVFFLGQGPLRTSQALRTSSAMTARGSERLARRLVAREERRAARLASYKTKIVTNDGAA